MIAILIPISQEKSYCAEYFLRGIVSQDYPKKDILLLFVIQQQGLKDLPSRLLDFQARIGHEYADVVFLPTLLPYGEQWFGPDRDKILSWKERAGMAAHMRAVGFAYLTTKAPDVTSTISLGCDVILHTPDVFTRLESPHKALMSGILLARIRQFPLVLSYDPANKTWDHWQDYPREEVFTADWTGMDILWIDRKLFTGINLFDFNVEEYGLGEDGWFCMEAKHKFGELTYFDPAIMPYHIHERGEALWAGGKVEPAAVEFICPNCQRSLAVVPRNFINVPLKCSHCQFEHYSVAWYQEEKIHPLNQSDYQIVSIT